METSAGRNLNPDVLLRTALAIVDQEVDS